MPVHCRECRCENPADTRFCGRCGASLPPANGDPAVSSTRTAAAAPLRELTPGTTFARRYQVVEELGRGGMGRVYKVFDTEVREKLALKLLKPEIADDELTIERFRNELRLARTISHRNICRMHDLGREDDTLFITMEYVSGEDLKGLIRRIGALPLGKAVSLARQICEGLEEAHRAGVVHRDLKSQNIMIDREGNARIMDFGIARSVKSKGITGANAIIGTPEYMSPEQVDGTEADRRSDVYALGVVLFEMATGRLPFKGETPLSVAVKQKSEPPPDPRAINPQVPEALARIILTCLEKDPGRRYDGARAVDAALADVQEAVPAAATPLPVRGSGTRAGATSRQITLRVPSKRIWIPAAVLLGAAAVLLWLLLPRAASARPVIAVLGFRNQTGDPAFDYLRETIPNLLITSLEQTGRFRVTTWQRLQDLIRQSGGGPETAFDEEALFELCRREGIDALAIGFYTKAGETFVTDVKVLDAATKQPLRTAQARGDGPASILRTQIDEISRSVARGLDRSLLKVEPPVTKVAEVTTSSLEAYGLFLRGRDEYDRHLYADAKATLETAIAIDPAFAAAHFYLARVHAAMPDFAARDESLKTARGLVAQAAEKERLYIEALYASVIERDPEKRGRILRDLVERYPDEKHAWLDLGIYCDSRGTNSEAIVAYERALALDPEFGPAHNQIAYQYVRTGDYPKAIGHFERYAALSPDDLNPRDSIAEVYMHMGRLDESAARYRALLADGPDFYRSWMALAYVNALLKDYPEAERCLQEYADRAARISAAGGKTAEYVQTFFNHFLGRWREARRRFESLREWSLKAGQNLFAAASDWGLGCVLTDLGEYDEARAAFDRSFATRIELDPSSSESWTASSRAVRAWVDVRQGRLESAQDSLRESESLRSVLTVSGQARVFADLMNAEILLARGEVEAAIAAVEKLEPPPLGSMGVNTFVLDNGPHLLGDVLARAYLENGDPAKAAAVYRKLVTIDPADRDRRLIHPLYHYRFGRVLERMGDAAGARTEYGKFLEFWKGADPTHPELADAKKRLAALG